MTLTDCLNRYVENYQADVAEISDSLRLLHGRGGCYPGYEQVTVDLYGATLLVTFYKLVDDGWESSVLADVVAWCRAAVLKTPVAAVVVQRRYLQDSPFDVVYGEVPKNLSARSGDLAFGLRLDSGQNCGFFLDMEPGRRWLSDRCANKKILNLFAYTCAFSVVAVHAGAELVVNVDMSRGALNRGRENHRLNGLSTENVKFLQEDILKSWGRIRRPGPYDVVIIDPPSYQPGSFVATRDYQKLIRRIPQLTKPGGDVLLCLNAPELGPEFLMDLMHTHCDDCSLTGRLPAAPGFDDMDTDRQLKLLHYRYLPAIECGAELEA